MNERDRLWLAYIAAVIEAARSFCLEGRQVFITDLKTHGAVIHQLEIVGEAVKRLSEEPKATAPVVPWRQIAGARDRLIHGYTGQTPANEGRNRVAGLTPERPSVYTYRQRPRPAACLSDSGRGA